MTLHSSAARASLALFSAASLGFSPCARGVGLQASDDAANYGSAVSQAGDIGLVGATAHEVSARGSAYVYRNLDTASGIVTENAELTASDQTPGEYLGFGNVVSQSGNFGLVGADAAKINGQPQQGAAYFYRNLDSATGTVTEDARLIASDGSLNEAFGSAVSLSGSTALVGAKWHTYHTGQRGAAYVFRQLNTRSGIVNENVKLTASDAAGNDNLGASVSLSASTGLVGAIGDGAGRGAAYVFRHLDTATGTITENLKLIASDGTAGDVFGWAASLSGDLGLVSAVSDNVGSHGDQGSAYVFRELNTSAGTITENCKLVASDGGASDSFGISASLSGTVGLVGASTNNVGRNNNQGSAYLFLHLDTASGTVAQSAKLTASDGTESDLFGCAVSVSGDNFVIGAYFADGAAQYSGKAYTGSVSAMTTLDVGNSRRAIDGISFSSDVDWIVGENTDANEVTLGWRNTASVQASGKAVYIGKNAGSDGNLLQVAGTLQCTCVYIGSAAGNLNNTLRVESTAHLTATAIRLANGNSLLLQGKPGAARALLQTAPLQVLVAGTWKAVTPSNFQRLVRVSPSGGYTVIVPAANL